MTNGNKLYENIVSKLKSKARIFLINVSLSIFVYQLFVQDTNVFKYRSKCVWFINVISFFYNVIIVLLSLYDFEFENVEII